MDHGQSFEFAGFRFSERRMELTRDGAVVPLGSRALDILACLLRNAGGTVSKDALMAAVWPGRVVEENNLTVHMAALRRALAGGQSGSSLIATDPGRGYRLVVPVKATVDDSPGATGDALFREGGKPQEATRHQHKPSVAALPFDNMSGDPDQTWFADGMVEDIITELSRSRSLFVVARNSSFSYRGTALDIRHIGAELGVRYVLEGSVRRSADRVRVNAQLIEIETGSHIWAERYDRDIGDMFAVQDEITRAVTVAIEPAVTGAEQVRAIRTLPENLGAWEAFQRGLWQLERLDPESNVLARELFERAIELDPGFAAPHAWIVHTYLNEIYVFLSRDRAEGVALAERHGLRALALDSQDASSYAALAWTSTAAGDLGIGLARCDQALALNPNHVEAQRCRAGCLVWSGRVEEARDVCLLCLRLSPRDPRNWTSLFHLTVAHYLLRDYDNAASWGWRVLDARPNSALPHRWLAAALGQLGRISEARAVMQRANELLGAVSFDDHARSRGPWMQDAAHVHMLEGLRLAGWNG